MRIAQQKRAIKLGMARARPGKPIPLVDPMLALKGDNQFLKKSGWITERKYDGFRVIAIKQDGNVRLFSRNKKEYTMNFPEIVDELSKIKEDPVVLDGEIVYLDKKGNDQFNIVQKRLQIADPARIKEYIHMYPVKYFVFDILEDEVYNRSDMENNPLITRKTILLQVIGPSKKFKHIEYTDWYLEQKARERIKNEQHRLQREGIMHKDSFSHYEEGRRSPSWRKHKFVKDADVMIVGYELGEGRLKGKLGAVYVAGYLKSRGLTYFGKVGTGFTDQERNNIKKMLDKHRVKADPYFIHDSGIKRKVHGPELKQIRWTKPVVIQVEYFELSKDFRLRFPVFKRLRLDKNPSQTNI